MSVAWDILRTYRTPRQVLRRRAAGPESEPRALAVLMAGCLLMFVAQWPRLSRLSFEDPTISLEELLGGALLGWMIIMPLVLYALAALSHVVARVLGGRATWYTSRMALFWALLAASPLWLLAGLVGGFIKQGPAFTLTGTVAVLAFFGIWGAGLLEVERGHEPQE